MWNCWRKRLDKEISMEGAPVKVESCVEINQGSHGDDVASMAWKLHAIEQTQLRSRIASMAWTARREIRFPHRR